MTGDFHHVVATPTEETLKCVPERVCARARKTRAHESKNSLLGRYAREARLEGADRPEVALGVPHVKLVATMGKRRRSGVVDRSNDLGTGPNRALVVAVDRLSVLSGKRDRGRPHGGPGVAGGRSRGNGYPCEPRWRVAHRKGENGPRPWHGPSKLQHRGRVGGPS